MHSYVTTPVSAHDPAAAIEAATCACHSLAADMRATLSECALQTRTLVTATCQSLATSHGIDWQGNAATLYRKRLDESRVAMEEVHQASQRLLALIGGTA